MRKAIVLILIIFCCTSIFYLCAKMPYESDDIEQVLKDKGFNHFSPILHVNKDSLNFLLLTGEIAAKDTFYLWNIGTGVLYCTLRFDTTLFSIMSSKDSSTGASDSIRFIFSFKDVATQDTGTYRKLIKVYSVDTILDSIYISYVISNPNHDPSLPLALFPTDKSSNLDTSLTLKWSCYDQDKDSLKYVIFLDTVPVITNAIDTISDTSFLVAKQIKNKVYYWKVTAIDEHGGQSVSPVWSFTTRSSPQNFPPEQPFSPVPSVNDTVNDSAVVLGWKCHDPNTDPIRFYIALDTINPPLKSIDTTSDSTYSLITTFDKTYYWQIRADDLQVIVNSPVWSFCTRKPNVINNKPYVPSNPLPVSGSSSVRLPVLLTWHSGDPDRNQVAYKIYLDTVNPPNRLMVSSLMDSAYSPDCIYGKKYYWKVIVQDSYADTAEGPVWNFVTEKVALVNHAPYTPVYLIPGNDTINIDTTVIFQWTGSDPDPNDKLIYAIIFDTVASPVSVKASGLTENSFTIRNLTPDKTYFWKIVTSDSSGLITNGPVWRFTVRHINHAPFNPTCIAPKNDTTNLDSSVVLQWSASDPDNNDKLLFTIRVDTITPPASVKATSQSSSTLALHSLSLGKNYYWKVDVTDSFGLTTSGPVWHFTTTQAHRLNHTPDAPQCTSPENNARNMDSIVKLTWTCSDSDNDNLTYKILIDTVNPPTRAVVSNVNVPNYSISNLINSKVYFWKIVGYDPAGLWTESAVQIFTTKNAHPSIPRDLIPANLATNVDTTTLLSWTCSDPDNDLISYSVFFDTLNPPIRVVKDTSSTMNYMVRSLSWGATYFWKIKATDIHGDTIVSAVNRFTVIQQNRDPNIPSNPSPGNNANNISGKPKLTWHGGDIDYGDNLMYFITYDTVNPPQKNIDTTTDTNLTPANLVYSHDYYWRVTARDQRGGLTSGPVWKFTTKKDPYVVEINAYGSDLLDVYLNGNKISFTNHTDLYSDSVTEKTFAHVKLLPGNNLLGVKLVNTTWGGWFALSFVTSNGDTIRTDSMWKTNSSVDTTTWLNFNYSDVNWVNAPILKTVDKLPGFTEFGTSWAGLYYHKALGLSLPTDCYFRKTFTSAIDSGTFKIRGNNFRYNLYINGVPLDSGNQFGNCQPQSSCLDVPATVVKLKNLRIGANYIALKVSEVLHDGNGVLMKAGVFTSTASRTDTSWKMSSVEYPNWTTDSTYSSPYWKASNLIEAYDPLATTGDGLANARWIWPATAYFRKQFVVNVQP